MFIVGVAVVAETPTQWESPKSYISTIQNILEIVFRGEL
jgi:hypothetical protein